MEERQAGGGVAGGGSVVVGRWDLWRGAGRGGSGDGEDWMGGRRNLIKGGGTDSSGRRPCFEIWVFFKYKTARWVAVGQTTIPMVV